MTQNQFANYHYRHSEVMLWHTKHPDCDVERMLIGVDFEGERFFAQYICMKAADGSIVNGWLASQTDMLSEDWVLVDPNEKSAHRHRPRRATVPAGDWKANHELNELNELNKRNYDKLE